VLRKDAKVELIRQVPLFAHCSKKELREVAALADEMDFPEGRTLTAEGKTGREFIVLIEGTADVRQRGRRINTLRAGDFLGEIALLSGKPRTATVTTTSPVRALVITEQSFKRLLRRSSPLQMKVLQALVERLPAHA
jgi:CRP-like cAMP-binding protein